MRPLAVLAVLFTTALLHAAVPDTDLVLPAVGRVDGGGGLQFVTTVWLTNPGKEPSDFEITFLVGGSAQGQPIRGTLAPGASRVFEDIATSGFGRPGVLGWARVQATGPLQASTRVAAGDPSNVTFSAIPKRLAVAAGQPAALQGVRQSGAFRFDMFLIETSGHAALAKVVLLDPAGTPRGERVFSLQPFEQRVVPLRELIGGDFDGSARISVESGDGRRVFIGSLVSNASGDAASFEMTFLPELVEIPGPQGPRGEPAGPRGPCGP